jgi:hypothetical protein
MFNSRLLLDNDGTNPMPTPSFCGHRLTPIIVFNLLDWSFKMLGWKHGKINRKIVISKAIKKLFSFWLK